MDNYVPFSDPWLLCWLGMVRLVPVEAGALLSLPQFLSLITLYPGPGPAQLSTATADNHCSAAAHLHNPPPALLPPKYMAISVIGYLMVNEWLPAE